MKKSIAAFLPESLRRLTEIFAVAPGEVLDLRYNTSAGRTILSTHTLAGSTTVPDKQGDEFTQALESDFSHKLIMFYRNRMTPMTFGEQHPFKLYVRQEPQYLKSPSANTRTVHITIWADIAILGDNTAFFDLTLPYCKRCSNFLICAAGRTPENKYCELVRMP
jgi:hypothetical protein